MAARKAIGSTLIACQLLAIVASGAQANQRPGGGGGERNGAANSTALAYANRTDFGSWWQRSRQKAVAGGGGVAIEVTPPPPNQLFQYQLARQDEAAASRAPPLATLTSSRGARTPLSSDRATEDKNIDHEQDDKNTYNYNDGDGNRNEGDDYNLLVTNTCERDFMTVELRTGRPFYGLLHALGQRRKLICSLEGDGGARYKLNVSLALNPGEPQHCGAVRVPKPAGELLSLIVAVRWHRNIELSEDKLFALNCTNRCRRPDCSSGPPRVAAAAAAAATGKLPTGTNANHQQPPSGWRGRLERLEARAQVEPSPGWAQSVGGTSQPVAERPLSRDACPVWRSAWISALVVLCLAVILLGMLISNCIICLSLKRHKEAQTPLATNRQLGDSKHNDNISDNHDRDHDHERQQVSRTPLHARQPSGSDEPRTRRKSRRKSRLIDYDNNCHFREAFVAPNNNDDAPDHSAALQRKQQEQLKRSHHHHHHHHHQQQQQQQLSQSTKPYR